jgi:hypothetical protein
LADHPIRASGVSQVPIGGRGVFAFTIKESGFPEDVTSVQFTLKNHLGVTIYDGTRTTVDIATTATDTGAVTITDTTGTGRYEISYTPPTLVYTPPAAGLQFSLRVIAVDEDGTADTGAISFYVIPADITIVDRSTVMDKIRRRTGIVEDIFKTLDAGTEDVDLGKGGVYELILVTKNGSVLTRNTHFTWNTYGSYLTLITPAQDGDEMFVQAQRVFSNDYIEDIIEEAESAVVYPALKPSYEIAGLLTSPTVEALIAAYTAGRLRQDKAKGATLDDPVYRSGWELIRMVQDTLKSIQSGATGVCAADGTELATKAGAYVGAFIHPDGAINGRLQAVDRAQRWMATLEYFWPEVAPDHVIDLRRLSTP